MNLRYHLATAVPVAADILSFKCTDGFNCCPRTVGPLMRQFLTDHLHQVFNYASNSQVFNLTGFILP